MYHYIFITRASKHRKESMTTKTSKTNEKSMSLGLKSHCAGLLLRKEKGKCDAAKHGAEFPNIGNHSPEQHVNQKWPYRDVTLQSQAET